MKSRRVRGAIISGPVVDFFLWGTIYRHYRHTDTASIFIFTTTTAPQHHHHHRITYITFLTHQHSTHDGKNDVKYHFVNIKDETFLYTFLWRYMHARPHAVRRLLYVYTYTSKKLVYMKRNYNSFFIILSYIYLCVFFSDRSEVHTQCHFCGKEKIFTKTHPWKDDIIFVRRSDCVLYFMMRHIRVYIHNRMWEWIKAGSIIIAQILFLIV